MPKVPIDTTTKGKKVYGSLTKSADLLDERVSEVSNVSKTISNMQKNVNKKVKETKQTLDQPKDLDLEQTHKSINAVLARLGDTIGALSKGITNVTVATAKATKDAIGDYASAVGRDINYNKQNIVAMALSRTSPIFGYFAAKFMETDVFRKAKEKITTSISNMFSSVFRKLRFNKKKDKDEYDFPHMARGGLVRKAGMAKLHAAEVVMPVDKYIKANQKNQEAFAQRLAKVQAKTFKETIGYETIGGVARQTRAMSYQEKMLELVTSIEHALYEQESPSFFRRIWDSMMKNSVFRGFVNVVSFIKKVVTGPFKMIFAPLRALYKFGTHRWRVNRGYWADLPKGKSVLENVNSTLGLTYAQQMSRLDSIILYTKATAQAVRDLSTNVTGIKYPAIPDISRGGGGFTIFGTMWKMITKPTEWISKGVLIGLEKLTGIKTGGLRKALTADVLAGPKRLWYNLTTSKKQKELDSHPLLGAGLAGTGGGLKKLITYQRDYYELQLHKRKGFPKLLGYSKDAVDELREINRREKRRTITGILGSLLGFASSGIGNIFKGIGGIFSSLGGGLFGLLGPVLGWLLGGKGGGGKGGFLGGIIKRAGSLIGRSMKWGFWNFLGMFQKGGIISKAVELAMKPLTAIGSKALEAIKGFGPKLLPFLRTGGYIAGAAMAGWEIGKLIDEHFGLSEKFNAWLEGMNKTAQAMESKIGKTTMDYAKVMKESRDANERYEAGMGLKYASGTGLVKLEETKKSAGWLSGHQINGIQAAQRKFIQENLKQYLPYSADEIEYQRKIWLDKGGLGFGQSINYSGDPVEYGTRYEKEFLAFLKKNGMQMSADEKNKRLQQYQVERNILEKAQEGFESNVKKGMEWSAVKYEQGKEFAQQTKQQIEEAMPAAISAIYSGAEAAQDKASEAIEYTTEWFQKKQDMLKSTMAELMGPTEAIIDQIDDQTKELRESAKETGVRMLQGAGHVATTVANSVTQSSQNIVNNNGGKFNSFVNSARESLLVMRGDLLP